MQTGADVKIKRIVRDTPIRVELPEAWVGN